MDTHTTPAREMLTADEASTLLRIRRPQIYALARDGIIPSVRIGRAVRFSRTQLLQWIEAGGASIPKPHA